ncbi:lysozyme C [Denticeps clupeoides]|uniref:lysozyme n=1 Tax=Denticeps clupeoides TaxID=299321 RepID=A0AAY4ANW3_9TELE|nr:lysozyme C, kidney isozyme-like [Denticeps clupeoides]
MMRLILVLTLVWLPMCAARQFERCEVAKIFKEQGLDGFEGHSLGNYICMAFWESKWKTTKVRESDVGKDYGIFQINSFKWCDDGTPGGKNQCKVACGELLKDDLTASITCAKTIVKSEGLKSWDTWDSYCNGRRMTRWVKGCGL